MKQKIKELDLPIFQLILAFVFDVIDILFVPLGYVSSFFVDTYLYYWAKRYVGLDNAKRMKDFKKKIRSNYFLRIVSEFIPVLNFLPVSTLFVIRVWSDRRKMQREEMTRTEHGEMKELEVEYYELPTSNTNKDDEDRK